MTAMIETEAGLVAAARALGAETAGGGLAELEQSLLMSSKSSCLSPRILAELRELIVAGQDPLGDAFSAIRSSEERRGRGATYTPLPIVNSMVEWASARRKPSRIVDPGVGSGRFLTRAGMAMSRADLIGIDIDPLATLMARANLAVLGMGSRSRIILGDYRNFVSAHPGRTLFIGNPPYVRHHQIGADWKDWLSKQAAQFGLQASKLSGLHVHFFLATVLKAKPQDLGVFITAAEWLDVNYGSLVRSLVVGGLGGKSVTVVEPTAQPFPDAATTAAITTFEIGAKPSSVFFRRVETLDDLGDLTTGRKIRRDRLALEGRWSHLTRNADQVPAGYVELGELCRVHRGTVTGANGVWIAGAHSVGLPDSVLYPTITKAREVLDSGGLLENATRLRRVIDIPADLDELEAGDRKAIDRFLRVARSMGGASGYIAQHRKSWWSVGLRAPAPIISTYMARRPPGFVINKADARHINIAHGLYPRDPMSDQMKQALVNYLQTGISQRSGRTYAGGLTKFEPREMERIVVPNPALLAETFGAMH